METLRLLISAFVILVILFFQSCGFDIEETDTNFKWVVEGNRLTYDLHMGDLKISDYRILEIVEDPGTRDNLIFKEVNPIIPNDPNGTQHLLDIFSHVYRLNDGLHTTACFSCNANPCLSVKNYLKIPAKPKDGQSIPDYVCGDNILSNDILISVDSVITVPLGNYKTFVINDTLNHSIKFWNEEEGLIRADNYDEHFSDTIKLVLSGKNY